MFYSDEDFNRLDNDLPKQLMGCIFVGHKATDLDSIASAVGCAELYSGIAARASEVNNESRYALEIWGIDTPRPFLEVKESNPTTKVCIVDHNQAKQCPDGLEMDMLLGCIDHHAMQGGTVSTSAPIYVNIQPWGSACTIVAHMFFRSRKKVSRATAGMLLSGILSDTLNLRSPTTTEHDCLAVTLLSKLAQVDDINELAKSLFKAKSLELLKCTPHQLVRGDLKTFECRSMDPTNPSAPKALVTMAFGVIETTDLSGLVAIREDLCLELRALKKEEKKDMAFIAFVDIVNLKAELLLVGSREADLAIKVFQGPIDPVTGLMHLGDRVSRKKQFIPPIESMLSTVGWNMPPLSADEAQQAEEEEFGEVQLECGPHGCQTVRQPPKHEKGISAAGLTRKLYNALNVNYADVQKAVDFALGDSAYTVANDSRKRKAECKSCDHLEVPGAKKPSMGHISGSSTPKHMLSPNTAARKGMHTPHMHHLDASALEHSEEQIRALLDTSAMQAASEMINKHFTLPTKEQFEATLDTIKKGNDPTLKFLVLALAQSFEKECEGDDMPDITGQI